MSRRHVRYLLIGGGVASAAAVRAIRQRDPEGAVLLVSQEASRPYHRPPLSKEYLRGHKPRAELFAIEADWFTANNVELTTGRRAAHLDTSRRAVTLDNGLSVSFDKLLIATGASPKPLKVPGAQLPNVFYLRTQADVERLRNSIEQAKREGRRHDRGRGKAAVVGSGPLGVDLAATLTQMGLHVDLFAPRGWVWERFVGEQTGRVLNRHLGRHGVSVHLNCRPERLEGEGRVQRVVLAGPDHITEPLECDMVAVAVGITANKELLRGTAIAAEKAILVDDHCRTNVPDIYAAGDCAAVFDPLFGKHRHIDHWENAMVTGTIAGHNMAGDDERYDAVSHFGSEVFGLSLSVWGDPRHIERRLLCSNPARLDTSDFVEIGIRGDGRVSQVVAVGHPSSDDELLRSLVQRRLPAEQLGPTLKSSATPLELRPPAVA